MRGGEKCGHSEGGSKTRGGDRKKDERSREFKNRAIVYQYEKGRIEMAWVLSRDGRGGIRKEIMKRGRRGRKGGKS